MQKFDIVISKLKFDYKSNEKSISFLDLRATLPESELKTSAQAKAAGRHQYPHCSSSNPEQLSSQLFLFQS